MKHLAATFVLSLVLTLPGMALAAQAQSPASPNTENASRYHDIFEFMANHTEPSTTLDQFETGAVQGLPRNQGQNFGKGIAYEYHWTSGGTTAMAAYLEHEEDDGAHIAFWASSGEACLSFAKAKAALVKAGWRWKANLQSETTLGFIYERDDVQFEISDSDVDGGRPQLEPWDDDQTTTTKVKRAQVFREQRAKTDLTSSRFLKGCVTLSSVMFVRPASHASQ